MVDKKPPNPVGNRGGKPKDQFDKKPSNSMKDWGGKPEDWWQCTTHR